MNFYKLLEMDDTKGKVLESDNIVRVEEEVLTKSEVTTQNIANNCNIEAMSMNDAIKECTRNDIEMNDADTKL